jgi:lipoate-protein ligase A
VLCGGRKFSGNAFAKGRHQRLHHGTILIRTDVEELQRYLKPKPAKLQKHGVASVQSRVVNLGELVPELTAESLIPCMVEAFECEYGTPAKRLDFDALAASPEVKHLFGEFADPEWKYGRWRQFVAQRAAQFDWGGVELSAPIDEPTGRVAEVLIASDSLFPDAIAQARGLLQGSSVYAPPKVEAADGQTRQIVEDIVALLYGMPEMKV